MPYIDSDEPKQKVIEALKSKGADRPCPRCGNLWWGVVDPEERLEINRKLIEGKGLEMDVLPFATVACGKCGFLALHALSSLGLFDPKE